MIYDCIVIGGGPAGLACSVELFKQNKSVLLLERESRLGGILKQCIHDGFGLKRFNERLTGPEYATRFINEVEDLGIEYLTNAFVIDAKKNIETKYFELNVVTPKGIIFFQSKNIVLSTGCKERTSKQIFLQGTRPYGVMTAGQAQALINLYGVIPGKKAVILGSGDIGLIMARRLTLSGVNVEGVYEVKPTPSGLSRNIFQCLNDYDIPLYLSTTVKEVYGNDRLTGVTVYQVDSNGKYIDDTKRYIDCDLLILSVGLIPENELGLSLGVKIDKNTHGPLCDNNFETNISGIYTCGNATHVNDLVDYVSLSAEVCARAISSSIDNDYLNKPTVKVKVSQFGKILYALPHYINVNANHDFVDFYFRPKQIMKKAIISVMIDGTLAYKETIYNLNPSEMKMITVNCQNVKATSVVSFKLEEEGE